MGRRKICLRLSKVCLIQQAVTWILDKDLILAVSENDRLCICHLGKGVGQK